MENPYQIQEDIMNDMNKEIWKDIKGYEGLYQVSNFGNVRSLDRLAHCGKYGKGVYKGKLLKPIDRGNGYYRISLSVNSKIKFKGVHNLVAETFIPNPDNKPFVCHIDNNTSNNKLENLYWGTQSENIKQCVRDGRHKSPFYNQ